MSYRSLTADFAFLPPRGTPGVSELLAVRASFARVSASLPVSKHSYTSTLAVAFLRGQLVSSCSRKLAYIGRNQFLLFASSVVYVNRTLLRRREFFFLPVARDEMTAAFHVRDIDRLRGAFANSATRSTVGISRNVEARDAVGRCGDATTASVSIACAIPSAEEFPIANSFAVKSCTTRRIDATELRSAVHGVAYARVYY